MQSRLSFPHFEVRAAGEVRRSCCHHPSQADDLDPSNLPNMPLLAKRFSVKLPLGAGNWSGKQLFILGVACAATACFTLFLASGDSRGQHQPASGGFAATSVGEVTLVRPISLIN